MFKIPDIPIDLALIHQIVGPVEQPTQTDENAVEDQLLDDKDSAPPSDSDESSSSDEEEASSSDAESDASSTSSAHSPSKPSNLLDSFPSLLDDLGPPSDDEEFDTNKFASVNELPPPIEAPPLPMEKVDPGATLRSLGKIKSAVGKMVIVECGGGKVEDVLGEGTIVCWEDGRVLGLVQDTFGPTTGPLYTMLLPEPFAAPPSALALAPAPSPPSTSNPPSTSASTPSAEKEVEDLIPADEPTVVPSSHPTTIQADDPTVVSTDANADILPEPTIPQDPLPIVPSPTPNPNPSAHPDQPAPPPPAPTFKPSDLVGLQVYYPYDMGKFVPTAKLRLEKWTDASNKFDEEVGMDEMEWSDDEAEAEARKRRKLSRNSRAPSTRGSPPPSFPSCSTAGSTYGGRSDDETSTVLEYDSDKSTGPSLPGRPLPSPYDDLDLDVPAGEAGSSDLRTTKKKSRERNRKRPAKPPADAHGQGNGLEFGGGRGRGAAVRGPNRGRGRGGSNGMHPIAHSHSHAHALPPRPDMAQPPPPPPSSDGYPTRPMSPTSLAIARATGQYAPSSQPQPQLQPQAHFPQYPPPGFQQPPYQAAYQAAYRMPSNPPNYHYHPAYPQPTPPAGQHQQGMYNAPYPAGSSSRPTPPGPPYPHTQDPSVQAVLQAQQAAHNKQILDMQRQIALLSRKSKGGGGGAGQDELPRLE